MSSEENTLVSDLNIVIGGDNVAELLKAQDAKSVKARDKWWIEKIENQWDSCVSGDCEFTEECEKLACYQISCTTSECLWWQQLKKEVQCTHPG